MTASTGTGQGPDIDVSVIVMPSLKYVVGLAIGIWLSKYVPRCPTCGKPYTLLDSR